MIMKKTMLSVLLGAVLFVGGCGSNCEYLDTAKTIQTAEQLQVNDIVVFEDTTKLKLFYPNCYYYNDGLYTIVGKNDDEIVYYKVTKKDTIEQGFYEVTLEPVHKHDKSNNCI